MADALTTIAQKFEPKIRDALLDAFGNIKDEVVLSQLEEILNTQGLDGAMDFLEKLPIEQQVSQAVIGDINSAIVEAGNVATEVLPAAAIISPILAFSLTNQLASAFIRTYQLNLIRAISNNTREAIRDGLIEQTRTLVNPKVIARRFKSTLGLTPNQAQIVRNYRNGLINLSSDSLDRVLRDKRSDSRIRQAIKDNQPLPKEYIDKRVADYERRLLRHRAVTIARTEALRATSIAEYQSILQAFREGALNPNLRRFWKDSDLPNVRPGHSQAETINSAGVRVDQPFTTPGGPLLFPRDPNGSASNTINCVCIVTYRII